MLDKIEPIFKNGQVPESLCLEHDFVRDQYYVVTDKNGNMVVPFFICKYCNKRKG